MLFDTGGWRQGVKEKKKEGIGGGGGTRTEKAEEGGINALFFSREGSLSIDDDGVLPMATGRFCFARTNAMVY